MNRLCFFFTFFFLSFPQPDHRVNHSTYIYNWLIILLFRTTHLICNEVVDHETRTNVVHNEFSLKILDIIVWQELCCIFIVCEQRLSHFLLSSPFSQFVLKFSPIVITRTRPTTKMVKTGRIPNYKLTFYKFTD